MKNILVSEETGYIGIHKVLILLIKGFKLLGCKYCWHYKSSRVTILDFFVNSNLKVISKINLILKYIDSKLSSNLNFTR